MRLGREEEKLSKRNPVRSFLASTIAQSKGVRDEKKTCGEEKVTGCVLHGMTPLF